MANKCKVRSFETDIELATAAAKEWLALIREAQQKNRLHIVALSGGRITKTFFNAVVKECNSTATSLNSVHFFWADERCVPADHPESNFRMADELLFSPLKVSPANIHRIKGELSASESVNDIIQQLDSIAPKNERGVPVFDVIFLGMGEDGHIASLFPNAPENVVTCAAPFCAIDNSPKPPPQRITLTYATIAAAREVWALVSGSGKENAFRDSLAEGGKTPLGKVIQSHSAVTVFSDLKL